jgi:site-specific DNA-adenine methylase
MTCYHGGKQRLGKTLAEIIVDTSLEIAEDNRFEIEGYCEPFCGMLGVYQHIPELFESEGCEPEGCEEEGVDRLKYLAGDGNGSVIKMWQDSQRGWTPPTTCSETKYNKMKNSKSDSALKGFIGHQYSFGGQWFNGYAPKYGKTNLSVKASKNVRDISIELKMVKFKHCDYKQFSNLSGYVIYCDPPYENSHCKYILDFDTKQFWAWCERMSKYNIIFISNYYAPKGTTVIYRNSHKLTGNAHRMNTDNRRIEKLYLM